MAPAWSHLPRPEAGTSQQEREQVGDLRGRSPFSTAPRRRTSSEQTSRRTRLWLPDPGAPAPRAPSRWAFPEQPSCRRNAGGRTAARTVAVRAWKQWKCRCNQSSAALCLAHLASCGARIPRGLARSGADLITGQRDAMRACRRPHYPRSDLFRALHHVAAVVRVASPTPRLGERG